MLTAELEFEGVVDPNYKNRNHYAILKLTEQSARRCSSPFVATPLQPYSTNREMREEASQGTLRLSP